MKYSELNIHEKINAKQNYMFLFGMRVESISDLTVSETQSPFTYSLMVDNGN